MSQLIQLRQRIKAINTIKKITHTMRLIAMSSHSRLRGKEEFLKEYLNANKALFEKVKQYTPDWNNPIINPTQSISQKPLIILLGSQRGLCGNFNTILFHYLEKNILSNEKMNFIVPVGKKAIRYCEIKKNITIVQRYPELQAKELGSIAHSIRELLLAQEQPYTCVVVVSNKLKTFFIQKPYATQILPLSQSEDQAQSVGTSEEYYWQQSPEQLLDTLSYQLIETQLHYLLFQSLLAEQAARFISMDNATRNVQNMLEDAQLQYNKLRQFKITKELTELSFNF